MKSKKSKRNNSLGKQWFDLKYYNNGDIYEGDYKDDKQEGKGIFYFNNGDREMGNYLDGQKTGKHVKLDINGDVTSELY